MDWKIARERAFGTLPKTEMGKARVHYGKTDF